MRCARPGCNTAPTRRARRPPSPPSKTTPTCKETLELTARERTRLAEGLAALGLTPLPTAANFVSAELPCDAAGVMKALAERDILTRDWRDPGHPRHIRITVGLPEDTDAVLTAMKDILEDLP